MIYTKQLHANHDRIGKCFQCIQNNIFYFNVGSNKMVPSFFFRCCCHHARFRSMTLLTTKLAITLFRWTFGWNFGIVHIWCNHSIFIGTLAKIVQIKRIYWNITVFQVWNINRTEKNTHIHTKCWSNKKNAIRNLLQPFMMLTMKNAFLLYMRREWECRKTQEEHNREQSKLNIALLLFYTCIGWEGKSHESHRCKINIAITNFH